MSQFKLNSKFFTIIIALITVITVTVLGYKWWHEADSQKNVQQESVSGNEVEPKDGDEKARYINEVYYIGGIGYPEVYDIPFQKSSWYVNNKEITEKYSYLPELAVTTADNFMESLLNFSYKRIMENEEEYVQNLVSMMDENWVYNEDYAGNGDVCEEYVRKMADTIIEKQLSVEGKFITDTSLVFKDGMIFVRGMVEYRVFSSADDTIPVTNKMQTVMMEVRMHRSNDDLSAYDIVNWYVVKPEDSMVAAE